ncbi:MAG TPA: tRNA lysidine(34) synthetase TilS [Lentisphaeria bacterium]|nr:MAG: tRNA lysidine(34) synthetase TilS [Lentisphaerae bacterium GWF2_38_69]HBM16091.1 tRNA lysidine(34) synthetase TilS [Lentisphaeria bacterium]
MMYNVLDNVSIFKKNSSKNIDLLSYKVVFAGFSGGADSTALLLILRELQKSYSFKLIAVHFEHGIRGKESLSDAEWCRQFCEKLEIDYKEFSLNIPELKRDNEGIEEAARRLRQQKWEMLASDKQCCVALGHHAGDKIENLLIRLFRGSSSSGLTSLRNTSIIREVTYIRPLLDFTKSQIEELLLSEGIKEWRIDSTNNETFYRRNFIRNELLPILEKHIPNVSASISASYSAVEQDARFIENEALFKYPSVRKNNTLSFSSLKELHPALRVRILRYFLTDMLLYDFIPAKDLIERFEQEMTRLHSEKCLIPLNGKKFLSLHKDNISVIDSLKNNNEPFNIRWNWKLNNNAAAGDFILSAKYSDKICYDKNDEVYFDAELLPDEFIIRNIIKGEKFIPFGSDIEIKVSKVLQNEKIPNRNNIVIFSDDSGKIYWLAPIRRSNLAKITDTTRKIVSFTIETKVD